MLESSSTQGQPRRLQAAVLSWDAPESGLSTMYFNVWVQAVDQPATRTWLLARRDGEGRVVFAELSSWTARLVALLVDNAGDTGACIAVCLATEAGCPRDPGFLEDVHALLRRMHRQGILLGTPENFGYMSGAMKYFFDHIYYPCLEHTQGLPYGVFIRAGNDGRGALMSVERIVAGLRWKLVCEPVIAAGELSPWHFEACESLGTTLAAGLEAGVF